MASKTETNNEQLITRITEKFELKVSELLPVRKGYRNESHPVRLIDGRIANIMLFKYGDGVVDAIRNADDVSNFLAANGFPTRITIDIRTLSIASANFRKFAVLYNYLPGETIAWEAYTQKHIKLLGKTLSDMHAALSCYDAGGLPDAAVTYLKTVEQMNNYFQQPGVEHAMERKLRLRINVPNLKEYALMLSASKNLQNQQALHMDFVRGNVLFTGMADGPEITGILDFEKTARGNPLFDIARTLAFLLVDCKYKQPEQIRKYFLYSGYQKRGTATLPKVQVTSGPFRNSFLEPLISLFLLHDFYKFLRHNPYEFLHENEHFMRTRDILLQRKLIFLANSADK